MNLFIRLSILALLASTSIGCGGYVAYAPRPYYAPRPMYAAPMYGPSYYAPPSAYGYGNYGYGTYAAPVRAPSMNYGRPFVRPSMPSYGAPTYRTAPMGAYGRSAPRTFYRRR